MKKITLVFSIVLLTSCSIKGNFQGLYSYYNKTKALNPQLFTIIDSTYSICNLKNIETPQIYVINGKMLKKCIDNNKTVIYIWSPKCKSKVCYPLETLQRRCDKENINLFIVAEYYDTKLMLQNYKIENPIFGINTKYYKTNLTSKYVSKFLFDLSKKEISNRFITFNHRTFVGSFNDFEKIEF